MFIPLHDDTPLHVIRFQYVTGAIIVINIAVFLVTYPFASDSAVMATASSFGLIPAVMTNKAVLDPTLVLIPEPLTLLTYPYVHGGWMHLLTNMLFLWVFADNIEDAFGHFAFSLFYTTCGVAAGLIHTVMLPTAEAPLIGASGAVSGIMASYLVLFPRARVWILLFMRLPLRISAAWVLGGWIILQLVSLFLAPEGDKEIAWWAHIGGFATGLLLTILLRNRLTVRPAP